MENIALENTDMNRFLKKIVAGSQDSPLCLNKLLKQEGMSDKNLIALSNVKTSTLHE